MYRHSFLWHALWLATPVLQSIVAWVMVKRRLVRVYPLFFYYTVFNATLAAGLFWLDHKEGIEGETYWGVYGVGEAITAALKFAIVYEVFRHLFRSYPILKRWGQTFFKWSFVLLLLTVVLIDRYGYARYLKDADAIVIDRDECGTLYMCTFPDDEPLKMVEVKNATPEPDGSFRTYFLRVPPQMVGARQSVAWTFGMSEREYSPDIQT